MAVFVARRLIEAVPIVFLSTIAVFMLLRLLPGDAAQNIAGENAPKAAVEQIRRELGLDEPLPVQYWIWMSQVMQGNLGRSVLTDLPVTDLIGRRLPATVALTIAGQFVAIFVGIPLGIIASVRRGTRLDWLIQLFNGLVLALPGFWLGILAILLFAVVLGWLPPGGFIDPRDDAVGSLKAVLLPAVTLALNNAAGIGRLVRSSMLEVLGEDYVRTARAKGLRSRVVLVRHALRNAMLPVMTVVGLHFGRLLGGAVITETVFTWPGLGTFLVSSIGQRDFVSVQSTLLLYIMAFIVVNLLTDISYGLVDPRIKLGEGTPA